MSEILIKALQNPALYPHPVRRFEIIETHLSWVILTGDFAYKLKKPLNLGFQDFSTLDQRKYYCDLELQLNQRLAPHIYIKIIAVYGSPTQPSFIPKGQPIEYAIQMQEFPQENLLSHLAEHQKLDLALIPSLAKHIAAFHQTAERVSPTLPWGNPASIYTPALDNFHALYSLAPAKPFHSLLAQIQDWTEQQFRLLESDFIARKEQSFIRACHGDLHLGNMVLIENTPIIFDCVEFNESFRWIDTISDVSFLAMDLQHQDYPILSHALINTYLEYTQDYAAIKLLTFYQCYRAMVRAKVAAFQAHPALEAYLRLAESFTQPQSVPTLTIAFGVSGSGKTFYTQDLLLKTRAICLRSDVIRKFLGLAHTARYNLETTHTVYNKMAEYAQMCLQAGYSVIIDATCLQAWERDIFYQLSVRLKISFQILAFNVPVPILEQRIQARLAQGNDFSEADISVLKKQLTAIEPLSALENTFTIHVRD